MASIFYIGASFGLEDSRLDLNSSIDLAFMNFSLFLCRTRTTISCLFVLSVWGIRHETTHGKYSVFCALPHVRGVLNFQCVWWLSSEWVLVKKINGTECFVSTCDCVWKKRAGKRIPRELCLSVWRQREGCYDREQLWWHLETRGSREMWRQGPVV